MFVPKGLPPAKQSILAIRGAETDLVEKPTERAVRADFVERLTNSLPAGAVLLGVRRDSGVHPYLHPPGTGTVIAFVFKDLPPPMPKIHADSVWVMERDYTYISLPNPDFIGESDSTLAHLISTPKNAKVFVKVGSAYGRWPTMEADILNAILEPAANAAPSATSPAAATPAPPAPP